MTMTCPRCSDLLIDGEYEQSGISLKMCEKCNGIFLKQDELVRFLNDFAGDMMKDIDVEAEIPATEPIETPVKCPDCRMIMENYGYMGSKEVKIDGCFRCRHIWLDADDIYAMSVMFARANMKQEIERKKRHDEAIADDKVFEHVKKQYKDYVRKGLRRAFR